MQHHLTEVVANARISLDTNRLYDRYDHLNRQNDRIQRNNLELTSNLTVASRLSAWKLFGSKDGHIESSWSIRSLSILADPTSVTLALRPGAARACARLIKVNGRSASPALVLTTKSTSTPHMK